MKLTFVEKYGSWVAFALLAGFSWYLISNGYHRTEELTLLFPLNWLRIEPRVAQIIDPYLVPYESTPWWIWVEVAIMAVVWFVIFFVVRGMWYFCLDLEGISMWVAFVILAMLLFLFFAILLQPVFGQVDIWWGNWPGMRQLSYPDG
jgi:hypothetical protein